MTPGVDEFMNGSRDLDPAVWITNAEYGPRDNLSDGIYELERFSRVVLGEVEQCDGPLLHVEVDAQTMPRFTVMHLEVPEPGPPEPSSSSVKRIRFLFPYAEVCITRGGGCPVYFGNSRGY